MSGYPESTQDRSSAPTVRVESGTKFVIESGIESGIEMLKKEVHVKRPGEIFRLTYESVRDLFDYDSQTGVVLWKAAMGSRVEMTPVTNMDSEGYLRVGIKKKSYKLHRVIWLWYYGYLPEGMIDHINKIKDDNRICNLREISHTCNLRNSSVAINNTTGVKGVRRRNKEGVYVAQIKVNNIHRHLCWTRCFIEAVCHRYAAEQCLDWQTCDKESSSQQFLSKIGVIK